MGGQNPYIKGDEPELPKQPYQITIVDEQGVEHALTIDPKDLPYQDHGLPGSILDICMHHGIELDHACGGVCACSTCHVHIMEGAKSCAEATEEEEDQLEEAYDLKANSRLGCQCVPNGSANIKIKVPSWNRNLAREPHGAEGMTTKKD